MTKDSLETKIAVLTTEVLYIKDKVNTVDTKVSNSYVTKEHFNSTLRRIKLLEKIVYGAVALILIAVGGALVSRVVE